MKILVTGFEPVLSRYCVNSSWEAIKLLPNTIAGAEILKLELPCRYGSIRDVLEASLDRWQPDVLVSTGHSGRTEGLEVEWLGVNRDDCSLADNDGVIRQGTAICEDGADAYFTDLPVTQILRAVRNAGIPAVHSYTAGQYLCNHALYLGRYLCRTKFTTMKSGFIHVPLCPQQAAERPSTAHSLELSLIASGLEAALHAIAEAVEYP